LNDAVYSKFVFIFGIVCLVWHLIYVLLRFYSVCPVFTFVVLFYVALLDK